jgi:hypothetical protein
MEETLSVNMIVSTALFAMFFAFDEDDLLHANQAKSDKTYWCLDCYGPVKRRRSKNSFYHFYHLRSAPTCRLYSKTEDHMLAQVQIEKLFPPGVIELEKSYPQIGRVADAALESAKLVFEVQCSPMTEKEAEMRIRDYRSIGYEVVWLLDDRRYNRRVLRPAEGFLRRYTTFYLSIKQGLQSECYDQFEVFAGAVRVEKGRRMKVNLLHFWNPSKKIFDEKLFPQQIVQLDCLKCFAGSRLERALKGPPSLLLNWRALEIHIGKTLPKNPHWLVLWFKKHVLPLHDAFLDSLLSYYE